MNSPISTSRLVWLILGSLFLGSLGLASVKGQSASANSAEHSGSQVLTVEGTVEVSSVASGVWRPATQNMPLKMGDRLRTGRNSRATVRLADLSIFRVSELSTLQILEPATKGKKPLLDLRSGSTYFFSRERPEEVQIRTPVVAGAIRGTEFNLQVAEDGETRLTLLDGEVELSNEQGRLVLKSGEQATTTAGQAPSKTAVISALNIIQWCLYYPAVLDPDELQFSEAEKQTLKKSLQAYRAGDLLEALAQSGDPATLSDATRIYSAALLLAVGRVDKASANLKALNGPSPFVAALDQMIAVVQNRATPRNPKGALATEWLAESYALQSHSQLAGALEAARAATAKDPSFGFAWVRVAELEFSFGRISAAQEALEKGLQLSPRNAQGLALKGFLFSAQNRFGDALAMFEKAIAADGALGNAWLGRGLCRIRAGDAQGGLGDLQVAATLEPTRSVLRSYLAKAFHRAGRDKLAEKDLRLAKQLDPNDPTSWLYSSLIHQQQNRINKSVRELEKSQELNDNRSVYRSRLLLDEDRSVRSANLATAYRDAGMFDVSVREASRAVSSDYANYSAHLFLSSSYELLRDPKQFNLRYESAQLSELLMYNLLAPVGAGNLSQRVSQQEYSRLFDGNQLGLYSSTEYRSRGDWTEYGSQYGNIGNTAYAFDASYHSENGFRPNNDLQQLSLSGQVKQQLTAQDSVYVQLGYSDMNSGDIAQYFTQTNFSPGLRVKETQLPNVYFGYHREWTPGMHTLVFAGRVDDDFRLNDPAAVIPFLRQVGGNVTAVSSVPQSVAMRSQLVTYDAELQQIWETGAHTLIGGLQYQRGDADTSDSVVDVLNQPVSSVSLKNTIERFRVYAYDQWQIFEPLHVTAGVTYDHLKYPQNIDTSPISPAQDSTDRVSPKAGLVFTPIKDWHLRAAYTRSLGGVFFDNSFRLEPTEIAGFNQAFRSLAPESAVGLVPATKFETFHAGSDYKMKTGTYLGVEGELLRSNGRRLVGVLTNSTFIPVPDSPGETPQTLRYEERTLLLTANQLISREWSLGGRYRLSRAALTGRFLTPGVSALNQDETATLHQLNLSLNYNHPCGFFGQFESIWSHQDNHGYNPARPGDDFWQHNLAIGYRFAQRRAEVQLALLNITDRDYQLNPLNLYSELPRERTLAVRLRLNF